MGRDTYVVVRRACLCAKLSDWVEIKVSFTTLAFLIISAGYAVRWANNAGCPGHGKSCSVRAVYITVFSIN